MEAIKIMLFQEHLVPDSAALAKLQLGRRIELQQLVRETVGPGGGMGTAPCQALARQDRNDIDNVEDELFMCDQLLGHLRTDGTHDGKHGLLNALDMRERARKGLVKFSANKQRIPETKFLEMIKTRDEMLKMLERVFNNQPIESLSTGHLKNRCTYVNSWEHFATEVLHISWVRWPMLLDLSRPMVRREENFWLAYMTYCRMRYGPFNVVEQALSQNKQFHEVHLGITFPDFPRLRARKRLGRKAEKKRKAKGETRKRRGTMKNELLIPVCVFLQSLVADTGADMSLRLVASSIWAIITCAFQLLFRIGELARGAEFDPNIHWSRIWLRVLTTLRDGEDECIPQPQRKVTTEHNLEFLPIYFQDGNPANFVVALKAKMALQPEHGRPGQDVLPDLQDVFAIDFAGTSPDSDFVAARVKQIFSIVHPTLSIVVTNHWFRRGGATCLAFMNVDQAIQEHAGGFSKNSKCRPAYVALVRETLVDVQRNMHKQTFAIVADDCGYTLAPEQHAAQPEPESPVLREHNRQLRASAGRLLDTEMVRHRDVGAMQEDSDDDEDEVDLGVAKRMNGELPCSDDEDQEVAPPRVNKTTKALSEEGSADLRTYFAPVDTSSGPTKRHPGGPGLNDSAAAEPSRLRRPPAKKQRTAASSCPREKQSVTSQAPRTAMRPTRKSAPPPPDWELACQEDGLPRFRSLGPEASGYTSPDREQPGAMASGYTSPTEPEGQLPGFRSGLALQTPYRERQNFSEFPWQHPESLKMFDMAPMPGVYVPPNCAKLCVLYQLSAWHDYGKCADIHFICSHCRGAGHCAAKCPKGGKEKVLIYKKGCKGVDK